jgi:Putative sensor
LRNGENTVFIHNDHQPPFVNTLVYLLLSMPLGIVYFSLVVTGLSVSIGTLIIWIGVPLLLITLLMVQGMATIERQIIARLLRQPLPTYPTSDLPQRTFLQRLGALLRDTRTWTSTLYMLLKLPLGIFSFVMAVTLPLVSLALTLLPLVYLLNLFIDMILLKNGITSWSILIPNFIEIHGDFDLTMFGRTFLIMPIGIVLGVITYIFLKGVVAFSRELAYALLGPGNSAAASGAYSTSEERRTSAWETTSHLINE